MSKALEAAEAAILEIMGPVIAHPEAAEDVIARMKARKVKAAKGFARAAILAFLREAQSQEALTEFLMEMIDVDEAYHADDEYERLAQHAIATLTRLAEEPTP